MPNVTQWFTDGKELAAQIEQRLDRSAGCYWDTQVWATKQHPPVIMINCTVTKIKRCSAHIPAPIVECEQKPTRQCSEPGVSTDPGIQLAY